jgi:hypothetical protein
MEFGNEHTVDDNAGFDSFSFDDDESTFDFNENTSETNSIEVENQEVINNDEIEVIEKSKFPQETKLENDQIEISIPSIDKMPEYLAFLSTLKTPIDKKNLIEYKKEIHIDFNKMNPKEASEQFTNIQKELKFDAAIFEYLSNNNFGDINKDEILNLEDIKLIELSIDEKISYIDKAIVKLSSNEFCKEDNEFLKKLYKLKRIENLVEDSIAVNEVYIKQKEMKNNIINLLDSYNKFVSKHINKISFLNNSKDSHESKDLINSLNAKSERIVKLEESLKNSEGHVKDIEHTKNIEIERLEKEIEELTIKLQNVVPESSTFDTLLLEKYFEDIDLNEDFSIEDFLKELSLKIEKNKKEIETLNDKLVNAIDEELYQVKIDEIERLEKEIEELKSEKYNEEIEADEKEFPQETNEDEIINTKIEKETKKEKKEKKPMSKGLKLTLIVLISLVSFIVIFFVIGSILLDDNESLNTNTNYAPAPMKKEQPLVIEQENNIETKQEVEPVVKQLQTNPSYDFSREISFEEFKNQKFDIYSDNFEKIRVNMKDFTRGEVINGFKFIKATSEGKILFVDKNSSPVWVDMK